MASAWNGLKNNLDITELPNYAINKTLPADSYFTSNTTSKKCIDIFYEVLAKENIDTNEYIFIEPSAGDGGFYDELPTNNKLVPLLPQSII